jgi:hypothetical protein
MCKSSKESIGHLLLHCKFASALWSGIFSHVGLAWVISKRIVDLFACWRKLGGSLQTATVWRVVASYILWYLEGKKK